MQRRPESYTPGAFSAHIFPDTPETGPSELLKRRIKSAADPLTDTADELEDRYSTASPDSAKMPIYARVSLEFRMPAAAWETEEKDEFVAEAYRPPDVTAVLFEEYDSEDDWKASEYADMLSRKPAANITTSFIDRTCFYG